MVFGISIRFCECFLLRKTALCKAATAIQEDKMNNYYHDHQDLTEEELDEFYRPRKTNNRKTLAPLFIYKILKEHSSPQRHLSQSEIIDMLSKDPYEIAIERKAVGRIIHLLTDSGLGIVSAPKCGTWYDPAQVWEDIYDIS